MRFVGGVRKEIKIPTIFNILGPLANPADANIQLLGVYDEKLLQPLAQVLVNLGVKRTMAVHGDDGLDEITATTTTTVCEYVDGEFKTYKLDPRDYGFQLCQPSELVGGTPAENAQIARDILSGKIKDGKRTAVILNAGAALHLFKQISLVEGIKLAEETLDSGKALETLDAFVAATNA
jgi:anthranilate phosphoribosyltransferase